MMTHNKILPLSSLLKVLQQHRVKKEKIIFTNGCFDILHMGHIQYLEKAKSLSGILIVALNSDSSIRKIKGDKRPIFSQLERTQLIASLQCVDYVTLFEDETPLSLIEKIKPDYLVKGADWNESEIIGREIVSANDGEVIRIPLTQGYSTSKIIDQILKKYSFNSDIT